MLSGENLLRQGEFWGLLVLVGAVLLNWPLLSLASSGGMFKGFPFVLMYLLSVWLFLIIMLYMFDREERP